MAQETLSSKVPRKVIDELGIDVPIMRAEQQGSDWILHLYGGRMVRWPPAGVTLDVPDSVLDASLSDLPKLGIRELRILATSYHIPNASRMKKAELIQAIQNRI